MMPVRVLAINLLFRNSATVAGIPIGSGTALVLAARDLENRENDTRTQLLRAATAGYGLKIRWRAQRLDPSKYRLGPARSQHR
jgi:hypothetical protein